MEAVARQANRLVDRVDAYVMRSKGRMQRMRHIVDALVAEPPGNPWYELLTPLLVATALVAIALLLTLIQMLLDA